MATAAAADVDSAAGPGTAAADVDGPAVEARFGAAEDVDGPALEECAAVGMLAVAGVFLGRGTAAGVAIQSCSAMRITGLLAGSSSNSLLSSISSANTVGMLSAMSWRMSMQVLNFWARVAMMKPPSS